MTQFQKTTTLHNIKTNIKTIEEESKSEEGIKDEVEEEVEEEAIREKGTWIINQVHRVPQETKPVVVKEVMASRRNSLSDNSLITLIEARMLATN
jgi:hypothetical protein